MNIITVGETKEYIIENVGKLSVMDHRAVKELINDGQKFGAEMLFKFEAFNEFGADGDTITFVQVVYDDFSYKIDGKTVYTWIKNEASDFQKRNYDAHGKKNTSTDIPLNYSIDQSLNDRDKPYNFDFRYPENRTDRSVALSNQDSKAEYILDEIEAGEFDLNDHNLDELNEPKYDTRDKKKTRLIKRLGSSDNIVPEVVYSAVKKDGIWMPGRMYDAPRTFASNTAENVKGNQLFETMLAYEKHGDDKLYCLCTLYWGWSINNAQSPIIIKDIECKAEIPEHFDKAAEQWNINEPIPFFKIKNTELYNTGFVNVIQ